MTTAIKRRRGTTAQHSTFTGLEGEITVDTTKDTLVVHDGATAGGFALLREDLSNNTNVASTSTTQTFTNKTINLSSNTISGTIAQFNTALSDGDFATLSGTETLSNKTFSTNPTISSGTANGVAYLNGSKVLTTGSALTFDGSNFKLSASDSAYIGLINGATKGVRFGADTVGSYVEGVDNTGVGSYQPLYVGGSDTRFLTSGSEQMRLTSTGLGIGTSSPSAKLQISGGNVRLSDGQQIEWGGSTNSIEGSNASNYLRFWTNNTARMTLDSSGNLGLGVTPSAWNTDYRAYQIAGGGALFNNGGNSFLALSQNLFVNSAAENRYIASAAATRYRQSAGTHIWDIAPSGTAGNAISFTQAMTLDANGNLGIGTTSPASYGKLAVIGGSIYTDRTISVNYGSAGAPSIDMFGSNNQTYGGATIYMRSGSNGTGYAVAETRLGTIFFGDTYAGGATVQGLAAENHSASALGSNLTFSTTPTGSTTIAERMRIDTSGNLLVGTTTSLVSPGGKIQIYATRGYTHKTDTSGFGLPCQFLSSAGAEVGYITTNNTTTTYVTSSDYRLKENIQPMQNALGVVAQLNPVTYTWKADGSDGQGFIAHELQAVVPDCVTGEKDAVDEEGKPVYQGIDTSFLVATLTKAIQEQQELINQLTARVAQLEGN